MSNFAVKVYAALIEPHPKADALELCLIDGWVAVVAKNSFKTGDLVAYIPEQAIVPQEMLQSLGLEGRLAGPHKNRVKAVKLRGVISQGLIVPAPPAANIGDDVTSLLGIKKWEPEIPMRLTGEVNSYKYVMNFDVENIKNWKHVFQEGEPVRFTEKLHGSCFIACLIPEDDRKPDMVGGKLAVVSKGLAAKGLYFKDNEKNIENLYLRAAKKYQLASKMEACFGSMIAPVWILGEVLGCQDLKYDTTISDPVVRFFGLKIGDTWLDWDIMVEYINRMELQTVPVLYDGPFSYEHLSKYTEGLETLSGKGVHIREGVVVYPYRERSYSVLGRVLLKSISSKYLLRDGDATEYQ